MSDALAGLEPRPIWEHFSRLATIPRPSKHEQKVLSWIRSIAADRSWDVREDTTGNLVVCVPASPGHDAAPTVVLQAHVDMVCEKNKDVDFDFMQDPIRTRVEGDWVTADGTTLGADNGIGVAAALAAATDPSIVHGPLELLFTLDEETGLTGAQGLDGSIVTGRTLINLDSEEDGKLFVGCAGGGDCHLVFEPKTVAVADEASGFELSVTGLRGGHSGLNIHENRGNAIKLAVRVLQAARDSAIEFDLAGLTGGSKHNAIPREAEARISLAADDTEKLRGVVARMVDDFRNELRGIDDDLQVELAPAASIDRVLDRAERDRLLDVLAVLPHGVLGMSPAIAGLVETSSNLAVVESVDGEIRIVSSARSSVGPTQHAVLASIRAAGSLSGVEAELHGGYPGWKPDMDSPVLTVTRKVFAELWDGDIEVTAVHAGLECGLLGEKVPDLDMISFGPQIEGAHSPDERVQISSVTRFYAALAAVLRELA